MGMRLHYVDVNVVVQVLWPPPVFPFQVNCLAFNPYSEYILATGSADKVQSTHGGLRPYTLWPHSQAILLQLAAVGVGMWPETELV